MITALGRLAPRTTDALMERTFFDSQQDKSRPVEPLDSLYRPTRDGRASGPYDGHVMQSSIYTRAMMSDVTRALPFIAAGAILAGVTRSRGQ
jgi:hypothetical protein